MKQKYKLTVFTRFILFMLFFAPAAYLGISYYNGENGIEKIKSMLSSSKTLEQKIEDKKKKIRVLENKIEVYKDEIQQLEASR